MTASKIYFCFRMVLSLVLIINNFEYSEMIFDKTILVALNTHGSLVDEVVQKVNFMKL